MITLPMTWAVVVGMLLLGAGCGLCAAVLTALGKWPRGFRPLATWGLVRQRRQEPAVWRLPAATYGTDEELMRAVEAKDYRKLNWYHIKLGELLLKQRGASAAPVKALPRVATCAGCGRGLTEMDTVFVRKSGQVNCHRCAGR